MLLFQVLRGAHVAEPVDRDDAGGMLGGVRAGSARAVFVVCPDVGDPLPAQNGTVLRGHCRALCRDARHHARDRADAPRVMMKRWGVVV